MSDPRLTAAETAARLGVKPQTLYAYVSRGLLSRRRDADGSWFDPIEVEEFAAAPRRGAQRRPVVVRDGRPGAGPLMTIDTDVALLEDDQLYYRGRPAADLARTAGYETVCRWLWTGQEDPAARFRAAPEAVAAVRTVIAALPAGTPLTDRLRVAVPVSAACDPFRDVLDSGSVARRAAALIAILVEAVADPVGPPTGSVSDDGPLAARLGRVLVPEPAARTDACLIDCLNAALVLLTDHDLAASTMAARVAASARANPYAVVLSGLGALDSALHGNASRAAARMLTAVLEGEEPRQVIARTIAEGRGGVPGFGHRLYVTADPRAEVVMDLLAGLPVAAAAVDAADRITQVVAAHHAGFRNIDLALAALVVGTGMPLEAGEVIFAIARTGGWVAHALDEYRQAPLRLRPVGRYVGP